MYVPVDNAMTVESLEVKGSFWSVVYGISYFACNMNNKIKINRLLLTLVACVFVYFLLGVFGLAT